MTFADALVIAFYGALAGAAWWALWHDSCLFWLGFWLVVEFLAGNAMWLGDVSAHARPGVYTALQVLVAVASLCAWNRRNRFALVTIVGVAIVFVCANAAFSAIDVPAWRQIHTWEVTTNLCFAAECLLAVGVGIKHGFESGRFCRWPFSARLHPAAHAARSAKRGSR